MPTGLRKQRETTAPDRQALARLAAEIDAQAGVVPDRRTSIARLRELMEADGVQPEDNGAHTS